MITPVSLKRVAMIVATGMAVVGASLSASATYGYGSGDWDVNADAGSYSPIALGDSIDLNACGSTYFNYNNQSQGYSLCSLSNLTSFTLTWKAKIGNTWTHITNTFSGSNTQNGLEVSVATGAGTFFSQAGTYYIGLYVTVANNSYVLLPSGSYGFSNNFNGVGNSDLDWSNSFAISVAPTPVPEPAAALLLLPGIALIARRERRRKAAAKA